MAETWIHAGRHRFRADGGAGTASGQAGSVGDGGEDLIGKLTS
ncbi:MAG: hypothetical protein ACTIJJ_04480 [Galactobacter sp.]